MTDVFAVDEVDALHQKLIKQLDWQEQVVQVYGRQHVVPRLVCWYGDAGLEYAYSGVRLKAHAWHPLLVDIRARVQERCGHEFNVVLGNYYRDGADGMGWHSDDEAELGPEPVVASVSFGAPRPCVFKPRPHVPVDTKVRYRYELGHGAVLLMRGRCQADWQHGVAKTKRPIGSRVNLTFRTII